MRWDIFCKVIDNHGDAGVCWRLAADLAARGEAVRLWIDQPAMLRWMAPHGAPGVEVIHWQGAAAGEPGDVVVEAFGCTLDDGFVAAIAARTRAQGRQPAWINLEYLSAQTWVERCHGLPSPVLAGPGQGLTKRFFYPGFTPRTGGLLRERDLAARQAAFDAPAWLAAQGIPRAPGERLVSLFCYEPPALPALLDAFATGPVPTRLLVTAGRAQAAVRHALGGTSAGRGRLAVTELPLLSQRDYDHLLWSCALNMVRGEDSLVRALWAGQAFVWQLYPQDDDAHHAKLRAFLDAMDAPASWRHMHAVWNGIAAGPPPPVEVEPWRAAARRARDGLLAQADLATQLAGFVSGTG